MAAARWIGAASLLALGMTAVLFAPARPAAGEDEPVIRPERIRVLGPDGTPLAGALLCPLRQSHAERPLFHESAPVLRRSDGQGIIDPVPDVAEAAGRLAIWMPGHAAVLVPATGFATDVRLAEAQSVVGAVRFAGGAPAARVVILAVPVGGGEDALVHRASTDAAGQYTFGSLAKGTYELFLRRSDRKLQPLGTYAAGDDVPEVKLVGTASVAGRLLDADGTRNQAAPGVVVQLVPIAAGATREAVTDSTGRFLCGDMVPGIYRAVLRGPQWEFDDELPRVDVRAGSTQHVAVWFVRRRHPLGGKIEDTDGKPLGGARVTLMRVVPGDPDAEAKVRAIRPALTTAGGAFRFPNVSAGDGYRLVVTAPGYSPFLSDPFEVESGRATQLVPEKLAPGWTLTLRARDSKGQGLSGVSIISVPTRHPSAARLAGFEPFVHRASTDAEGVAVLRDMPDSDVRLVLAADGWLESVLQVKRPHSSREANEDVTLVQAHRITGRVSRDDARRVEGYEVHALPRDGSAPVVVRTDSSGKFRFPTLRPVATDVEVRALSADRTLTLGRVEAVLPTTAPHLDIVLPSTRTLSGLTTGLDGTNAEAVVLLEAPRYDPVLERHRYVTVLSQPLEIDDRGDGLFEIADVPPGVYALRAVQGTRDSSALTVRVGEEDLEDLRLPIPAGARIGGTVSDGRQRPILGAYVRLERVRGDGDRPRRPGGALAAAADDGGTFVFDDVAPGVWRLTVQHERYAPVVREVRVSEGEVLIVEDLTVDQGGVIAGRALSMRGEALDGALITARRLEDPAPTLTTRTDASGGFELPRVRPGAWFVTLDAPDEGARSQDALVEVMQGARATVDFAVAGRAVVEGTVTLAGNRVAGALIELVYDPGAQDIARYRHRTQTNGGGGFRFTELLAGTYHLYLEHGSARVEQTLVIDDVDRLVLDLDARGGQVGGKVVTTQGDRVPGAEVIAKLLDADGRVIEDALQARGRTGPQGEFLLTGLPVGWYALEVTAPGYPPGVLNSAQAELAGADHPVTVVLGRGGTVDMTIMDDGQRPVSGARVWLEDVDGVPFHSRPYTTGPGGQLLIDGVPAGEVRVRVQAQGFGRAPVQALFISEGGTQGLRVKLRRPGTLRLIVRGTGRDPVTRARISILREGTSEVVEERRSLGRLRLDPRWGYVPKTGVLNIDDLETGAYEIVIDAGDTYAVQRMGVDVESGSVTTAEIVLVPR